MQGGTRAKYCREQIVREICVQWNAAFDVGSETDLTLDHNQCASLALRKQVGREHDVVIGLLHTLSTAGEGKLSSDTSQCMPDLILEDHDQGEYSIGQQCAHQEIHRTQFGNVREI